MHGYGQGRLYSEEFDVGAVIIKPRLPGVGVGGLGLAMAGQRCDAFSSIAEHH